MNEIDNSNYATKDYVLISVDIEKTKQELKTIYENSLGENTRFIDIEKVINKVLEKSRIKKTTQSINQNVDIESIFGTTLQNYIYDFSTEQRALLKQLVPFDEMCLKNDMQILYKLDLLLSTIFSHIESLAKLDELEEKELHEKGIAKTPHPKVLDAITPRQNHIRESIKYNPTDANKLQKDIYDEFATNPEEIVAMYDMILPFGKGIFKNISQEKLDTLFNQSVYLNSAVKLEDYHIFTSCQIASFLLYKDTDITSTQLSNILSPLIADFFDGMFTKKLTRQHIAKETQVKSFFNGIEIFEYRTKSNYKEHPIFKC